MIATREPTKFEVLIAFKNAPRSASGYPPEWLTAAQVSHWLKDNGFAATSVRPSGGLILSFESKDTFAAANSATAVVDRYVARASIATGRSLNPWPSIRVKGHTDPFPYQTTHRGVRVKALYREDQVFSNSKNGNVDAAIELLAHLENSSPSAAVAGGWGAIEALLGEPGDRAAAADALGALVACSIPRAELTYLVRVVEQSCIDLAPLFLACGKSNRDRATLMARLIASNRPLDLPRATDRAALQRMDSLIRNPSPALSALQVSVSDAFHRLYRQRNLILHGGITDSIALVASLRTASKVAGAGIDRVAHGAYVQGLRPLELAARARLAIAFVPAMDPSACVDLLGA